MDCGEVAKALESFIINFCMLVNVMVSFQS